MINGHKVLSILVFAGLGVYSGTKFFEPLIVEQLRKDGNLRQDIPIPEFDRNGDRIIDGVDRTVRMEELKQLLERKE